MHVHAIGSHVGSRHQEMGPAPISTVSLMTDSGVLRRMSGSGRRSRRRATMGRLFLWGRFRGFR